MQKFHGKIMSNQFQDEMVQEIEHQVLDEMALEGIDLFPIVVQLTWIWLTIP